MLKKILQFILILGIIRIFIFTQLYNKKGNNNILTLSELQEDYNYMWYILENNFIHIQDGELAEQRGVNIVKIREKYYNNLNNLSGDIYDYYTYLDSMFNELTNNIPLGHLGLIPVYSYEFFPRSYPKIFDKNTKKHTDFTYNYIAKKTGEIFREDQNYWKPYHTSIIEDGEIAYIGLTSMLPISDLDKINLLEFYKEISEYGYLIIDIQNNPGGSTSVWMDNIVKPNVNETVRFINYKLFMGGDYNLKYSDTFEKVPLGNIEDFYLYDSIDSNTSKYLDYYYEDYIDIEPLYDEKIFKGEIFVLINEKNYSAADNFAYFCKQTNFAKLIGRNTNGGGTTSTMSLPIILPNSGIVIRYDHYFAINDDGSSSEKFGTSPDIYVSEGENIYSFAVDYIKNITR